MSIARRPVVLLGAGGHAKVVLDLLRIAGWSLHGVCDPTLAASGQQRWRDIDVLGDDDAVFQIAADQIELANGLGSLPGGLARAQLYEKFVARGYRFTTLVHPSAVLGEGVTLASGVQVMAGAILQADVSVAENSLLNTAVRIDHDCEVGAHVHIGPGAVLSGGVIVESYCHIGVGATVIQGLRLGEGSVVGAGTTVLKPLSPRHWVTGQPPRAPYLSRNKSK